MNNRYIVQAISFAGMAVGSALGWSDCRQNIEVVGIHKGDDSE